MKKLLLVVSLLFVYNSDAANLVPVVSGVPKELQGKVYHQITNNGFIYLLDPAKRDALSPAEITQVIEDEQTFVTRKIHEVCPDAQVTFIPKSLYQLFVYSFVPYQQSHAIIGITKSMDGKMVIARGPFQVCKRWRKIAFRLGMNKGWGGLGFYADIDEYNDSLAVQSTFWEINDGITSFLAEQEVNCDTLPDLTGRLIDTIDETCHRIGKVSPLTTFKNMITEAIVAEYKCPKDTYRIYRAGGVPELSEPSIPTMKQREGSSSFPVNASFSFSDGLGAGLILDSSNGSALGFVIKNRTDTSEPRANMMCVDLPKRDLLANKLPIVIPPVSPIGSALGRGEFHHPRTKKVKDGLTHGFLVKFEFQIPTEYFSENGQKIADFWNALTLVSKVEYECGHRVSVETYSYTGEKTEDKEAVSSDRL